MDNKDYYKILGISKTASADEIKKAFRKLAKQYHPDKKPGDKAAEAKFKDINEANEVLSDPEKRKQYDEFGSNWQQYQQQQQGAGAGGFDSRQWQNAQRNRGGFTESFDQDEFSDFFNSFFNRAGTGGGKTGRKTSHRGDDYSAETTISLEEAYQGSTRILELNKQKLRIQIKPGIENGQTLRVKGKGAQVKGAEPGDLYLTIHISPHHLYHRKGNDIEQTLKLDVFTAILGGKSKLHTFTGDIMISIPPGTQNGKILKLKGKGMPVYGKPGEFGDMLVKTEIKIPTDLNDEQKDLLKIIRDKEQVNVGQS
jgi:curved DNA-binding protein